MVKDIGVNAIQSVRTHAVSEPLRLVSFPYTMYSAMKRGGSNNVALIHCAAATVLNAFPDQEESSC